MNPASTISEARSMRPAEPLIVLRAGCGRVGGDEVCGNPEVARDAEPRGRRLVGENGGHLVGRRVGAALHHRAHVAAPSRDQDDDLRRTRARSRDDYPRVPSRTSPMTSACAPPRASIAMRAVGIGGRHVRGHADAAIEYAVHLRVGDAAGALQPIEHRVARHARRSSTAQARREHTRNVLDQAAAGDVRHAVHRRSPRAAAARLDVDAGRRQQPLGERDAVDRGREIGAGSPRGSAGSARSRSNAARSRRGRAARRPATICGRR